MQSIIRFFVQGGPLMYAILFVLLCGLAVIIDRFVVIRFKNRIDTEAFAATLMQFLKNGAVDQAVEYCSRSKAALPRIVRAGLLELNRSERDVQNAMELAAKENPLFGHVGQRVHPFRPLGNHSRPHQRFCSRRSCRRR